MTEPATLITGAAALLLASVHVIAAYVRLASHRRWLSLAAGVVVAYVFVHLLPEIARHQQVIRESDALDFLEHRAYLFALLGLVVFYGLEIFARRWSQSGARGSVFWIHVSAFALYSALIGYLLHERAGQDPIRVIAFAFALGLHLFTVDQAMEEHHQADYERVGRWVLTGSVLLGWGAGALVDVAQPVLSLLFHFIAGGIVLNALKEELPSDRESRFWPFVLGAGGYTLFFLIAV